jgi:hypothetical protein
MRKSGPQILRSSRDAKRAFSDTYVAVLSRWIFDSGRMGGGQFWSESFVMNHYFSGSSKSAVQGSAVGGDWSIE